MQKADVVLCRIDKGLHSNFDDEIYIIDTRVDKIARSVIRGLESFISLPSFGISNIASRVLNSFLEIRAKAEQVEISVEVTAYFIQQAMRGRGRLQRCWIDLQYITLHFITLIASRTCIRVNAVRFALFRHLQGRLLPLPM